MATRERKSRAALPRDADSDGIGRGGIVSSADTARPEQDSMTAAASLRSVERAVSVLRLFLPNRTNLGLTEIAQLSGLSVSTAHRYCSALRRAGLLRFDADTGQFALGGGCIELGLAATESLPVVEFGRPILSDLVSHVDRTAVLAIWDEYAVRVVEVNDHTSSIVRVTVRIGSQLEVFSTAQGILFLAFSPRVSQRFARHSEMDDVKALVAEAKKNGFVLHTSPPGPNKSMGTRTAAAPILLGDQIVATIAILGPIDGMVDTPDSRLVTHLREAAAQLSARLTAQM